MVTFSLALVDVHFQTRVLSCVISGLALVDFCVLMSVVLCVHSIVAFD